VSGTIHSKARNSKGSATIGKIPAILLILTLIGSLILLMMGWSGLESLAFNPNLGDEPTPPPMPCPEATQDLPPAVEPVISPTNLSMQTITAFFRAESMTVINELGSFTVMCNPEPCSVLILLKPDTINHLTVVGKYSPSPGFGGCIYPGYTISVASDKNGNPLEIEQIGGKLYALFLPVINR